MSKKKRLPIDRKKMNVNSTNRPIGIKKTKSNAKLIFVVQEHHAKRIHYDFRLEWEGVLKSWAIPKGPSQVEGQKRLAVQTEDHPIEYGSFAGRIPPGQYGAGEVAIWDKGNWEPLNDPFRGFQEGHLDFRLKGSKLSGIWSLIRIKLEKDKDNSWLLIKKKS